MRHQYYILDKERRPVACSMLEWGMYFNSADRHVGLTKFEHVTVSTVFLGLDHRHDVADKPGPPILFETMVFLGDDEMPGDRIFARYVSWDDADAGHKAITKRVAGLLRKAERVTWEALSGDEDLHHC